MAKGRSGAMLILAGWLLPLGAAAGAGGAQLSLGWAGGGTDRNPGTWTIRLTDVDPGARGTYTLDGGEPAELLPGKTPVAVPGSLGTHVLAVTAPGGLGLTDRRAIVDDDPTPPQVTLEYAGRGTRLVPGVWMITLFDPESPGATGTYRVNDGAVRPLPTGSTVIAVPYYPGTYTITVTATNNDRDRPGDEDAVTLTDTREVR